MSKTKIVNHTKTDPRVSCPIVCGEYLRASGFFFEGDDEIYLVTARHNILPTNATNLKTNKVTLGFSTDDFLPIVDIYLRTSSGFNTERLDIRKRTGIRQTPEIDVIGIPIDFNPEEYGYQVWDSSNVVAPTNSPESIDIIGFNGMCFPNSYGEYEFGLYQSNIRKPVVLQLVNEMPHVDDPSNMGLTAVAIDDNVVDMYTGLSGSPVLGDQIVGVHAADVPVPDHHFEQPGKEEFRLLVYWRAEILPELFK